MPPRKKAKTSPPQPEKQSTPAKTPTSNDSAAKPEEYDPVADPWTDEQETALLKGIVRWKPVGMHKHFRMLAISEYMRSQGYAPSDAEHTRIPGIWKKLGTLYNLQGLDEREDSLVTDTSDETENTKDAYCPFELPEDEFGEMMFERRLAKHPSSSPVASAHMSSRRGSTVADTDEPRSSPAAPRGRKSTRGGRRSKRSTRLQAEVDARQSNEEEGDSDEENGANEEGDKDGAEATKGDSDGEEEAEEAGSPTTRGTRSQASRSKQPEKQPEKGTTGTGTRRTGRRR